MKQIKNNSKKQYFLMGLVCCNFLMGIESKAFIKNLENKKVKNVYSGVRFQYFDQEDRISVVEDFYKTVYNEYALLPIKEKKFGISFLELKNNALKNERSKPDILLSEDKANDGFEIEKVSFLQAESNLEFIDRMKINVAQFRDTHFDLDVLNNMPTIYTGLFFQRVGKKIIVSSIDNNILVKASKLSDQNLLNIKIGDEVLLVDNKNVEDKILELKKFQAASSDEYADRLATQAINYRKYAYEKKNYIKFEFKNAGKIKLPLFMNVNSKIKPKLDAYNFLTHYKYVSDSTVLMNVSENNQLEFGSLDVEGYKITNLPEGIKELKEYKNGNNFDVIKTGYILKKGKSFALIQLTDFLSNELSYGNAKYKYLEVVENFIKEVKSNGAPLIIDVRFNSGGKAKWPKMIMEMMLKKDTVFPGPRVGYRITPYLRQLQELLYFQEINGENQNFEITIDELQDIFQNAVRKKHKFTAMVSEAPLVPKEEIEGFDNPIVALISSSCISACDIFASLLESTNRATLIGTHSNGTGAGYSGTNNLNTNWNGPFRIFNTKIPNFLFGKPSTTETKFVFEENSAEFLSSENEPVFAKIPYANTEEDILNNNIGWYNKVIEVLEQKPQ